ncbi:Chitinase A1 precursor [Virgibacillus salexigens]|uniref:chitinase n=2 Tax=Bacillaceae TaxID=186817 RepID=A0A024Q6J6_9BACI|nr:Chitinase A1 precursor [Virgibacillus massiliensis]
MHVSNLQNYESAFHNLNMKREDAEVVNLLKGTKKFFIFFIFGLLILTTMPTNHSIIQAKEAAASDYNIVGYYPSWAAYGRDFQVWDMDASKVSHINYAFADICWDGRHGNPDPESPNPQTWACQDENGNIDVPNGTVVMGDPWIDAQKTNPGDNWDDPLKGNFQQLIKLKEENPHLKTFISIGGWSWSNRFSDVAADPTTREQFANSAVDFIRKYGFDGVDIDWEYPVSGGLPGNSTRPEDKQNYVLLLQEVREKLDAAEAEDGTEYLLTIASAANEEYVNNNELTQIAEIVDWINIMTYDFNGGWQTQSGHNAPLYFDPEAETAGLPNAESFNVASAVNSYLNEGVPGNKLVLGTPFYGRGWSDCEATNNGEYQNCSPATEGTWENGTFDFSDLEDNYINKNGYQRYWNDEAKVPYLYNASNGNFITYDDEESFGYKTDFIKSKGLAGAMFWDYSGDVNHTLVTTLATNLQFTGGDGGDPESPALAPQNVEATKVTASSIDLSWNEPTDATSVVEYVITYNNQEITTTEPSIVLENLQAATAYTITVSSKDGEGNLYPASSLTVSTSEEGATCEYPAWEAATSYVGGDRVQHNNNLYEAKWWTKGEEPGTTGEWGPWKIIESCNE